MSQYRCCSRRVVLGGLGAAALTSLLPACGTSGSTAPAAKSTACGSGTCIDLGDPANQPLAVTDGAMTVDLSSGDPVMVIRTAADTVIALSAVCTHAGCLVDFTTSSRTLDCPCHGSQFAEDGRVLQGPARTPLRVYTATLSGNTITIA